MTADDASDLARRHWGLEGAATEVEGDVDRNFRLVTPGGRRYVLKVARNAEGDVPLDVRQEAVDRVAARCRTFDLPAAVRTGSGHALAEDVDADGRPVRIGLAPWFEGIPLARYAPHDEALLEALGRGMGEVSAALADFDHPSLDRSFHWTLHCGPEVVDRNLAAVEGPGRRDLLRRAVDRVLALDTAGLPRQAVHGDANDFNVLVRLVGESPRLALLDFGDMGRSWRAGDPAIAAAYAVMGLRDPLGGIAAIARGFHDAAPLSETEADALVPLVGLRLAVSVALSAVRAAAEPDDPYLVVSERPAWELLGLLDAVPARFAAARIRAACGMGAPEPARRVRTWLERNGHSAAPVLGAPYDRAIPMVFDLSVGSAQFELDPEADAAAWQHAFDAALAASGATLGVGRWLEPRGVYSTPRFLTDAEGPERGRTVHLGIDLFAPPGTPVRAPFDAVVETVADNAAPRDYGPTVVLRHEAEADRPEFRTLYGHLAQGVLHTLKPGDRVAAGVAFAALGEDRENGGWPPHLHFQVLADSLDRSDGDFPGVALPSEAAAWASLCPDPDLVLGLGVDSTYARRPDAELLERRRERLGPNLSVSYRQPLQIVRGRGAWLYDADGRRYLDGVNNVAHVGHGHPRVVAAARRQLAVLNTNTRYLHGTILEYADELAATLPDGLDVCFFVNSGSEANDLALRMARAATGRSGFVAVDGAYHGHLESLIAVSPYKFDGPGGRGRPDHVRIVRMPDPYRGELRGGAPDLGERYAADVRDAAMDLADAGYGAAAFVTEAILSCGGQVVPPPGWLPAAAAHARAGGALYVADEVQTGFGRVGTHFWAFEALGAVPDIVTMGKPIGNGFPLGAVVTTRAVADAFANGMEYFNTYGGNAASCAVGLEVLRVIRDEGLQERALAVGTRLMAGFRSLVDASPLVGDVRGMGLFSGFELVLDRETREPASAQASRLVNRMRERGVLLSTDGPDHDVIKVKPPLVISEADADEMIGKLHDVLGETYFLRP